MLVLLLDVKIENFSS